MGFESAFGCTGRDGKSSESALRMDVRLDGRVTSRIEYFPCLDSFYDEIACFCQSLYAFFLAECKKRYKSLGYFI